MRSDFNQNTKKNKNYLSIRTLRKNNIELVAPNEEFAQIPRWQMYFISNYGRLVHKNNDKTFNLVNHSITKQGYLTYTLSKGARTYNGEKVRDKNGKTKTQKSCQMAQRLVAKLFVDSKYPEQYKIEDLQVHHKDKNPKNNYYKNLMYLCKNKNGRKDHDFVHTIKKISYYTPETAKFYGYNDIELLIKRVGVSLLEFLDSLKYGEILFKSQDGKWDMYRIGDHFIGVQFYKR